MTRSTRTALACLAWTAICSLSVAQEPPAVPAVRIRLSHPDEQLREVIQLFEGTRAANPAAALAAWKRASKEPNRLGKPLEALIAALNPKMIDELKTLDGAEISIRFDPKTGDPEWSAILPKDDGTFAALASALVLSGGQAEPPLGDLAVDRLAGPGSALMAHAKSGTLIASSRDGLSRAQALLAGPLDPGQGGKADAGVFLKFEPDALKGASRLELKRLAELLRATDRNPREIRDKMGYLLANLDLDAGGLLANLIYVDHRTFPKVAVNPSWYDWTPKDRTIASFALAADPSPQSWQPLFALADRVEKLDPTHANVSPIQVRLELLGRVAGFRLETDLLRHLLGVSGWVGSSDSKTINQGFLALQLDDQDAAERIVAGLRPIPGSGTRPAGEPDRPRWLGKVNGQSIRINRSERAILIGWGEGVIEAALQARDDPNRSAGQMIRELVLAGDKPMVGGVVWPDRLPQLGLSSRPKAKDDIELTPLFWLVFPENNLGLDVMLGWADLAETVKRVLETLPLDPPPDH